MPVGQLAARQLGRRAVRQVGAVALAGVDDEHPGLARPAEHALGRRRRRARSSETSLPSASPKPPGSTKSRCMSITISAVVPGSKSNS